MDIDRPFGGANGGGLVVLNEDGTPGRSTDLIPGFRFIDRTQTNPLANDFFNPDNPDQQARIFTNPTTGVSAEAQPNRAGLDYADFDGFQNAVASLDGFNETSADSLAEHNRCVFPGDIDGDSVCAATNGLNREQFAQQGTQLAVTWDATENLSLKYIYGFNQLSYQRTTDDDNTSSQFHDRQFYVNHEADYSSHELQAFWDITDNFSITVGGFIYDATIDQRGDFYSSVFESRFVDGYNYNPSVGLGPVGASIVGLPVGTPVSALLAPTANVGLFTAKNNCLVANPSQTCAQNYSVNNSAENLTLDDQTRNDNLVVGLWEGDDGSDSNLNVINGINSVGSDLLYATQTEREATAVYTQGVWNISEKFALTVGLRYAVDEVTAEENLFRYTETFGGNPVTGDNVLARFITDNFATANDLSAALYALNAANGGFALDAAGDVSVDQHGQPIPTQSVVNAGFPIAVSVYRPFQRDDEKLTGRINLDWDVTEEVRLYFSATSGYRSGGYNLVFFSNSAAYDPEELIAYEFGYKTRFFDNTLQINGSVYFYDYDTIHTVATEVTSLGGTSTSVLEAPGAEIKGIEAEILWLATERITLGGNFSFTPSEYTEDLSILDPARVETPTSLFPDEADNTSNINGNQLLQVPESKFTVYGTYSIPMNEGAKLDLSSVYSWTDEVYYSPFENDREKAEAYGRLDIRATWTNAKQSFVVAGYVNNILDDVAVLQVLRHGENENFRQSAGITLPRAYGLEFTLNFGGN
jgi:hypothetical protein